MLARYMLPSCVCLTVRLSVTRRYCTKTAKHMITQTTPTVFWCQRYRRNSNRVTPTGAQSRGGVGSDRRFSTSISLYLNKSLRCPLTDPHDAVPHAHRPCSIYTDVDGQCNKLVTDNHYQFTSRHCTKKAEQIKLVFGTLSSIGLSYAVLEGNSGISKNKAISLLYVSPKL